MNSFAMSGLASLGLGIVTAIHPCLMVLNISALALLGGQTGNLWRSVARSMSYLTGRAFGYFAVSIVVKYGLFAVPTVALFLQNAIFRFIGPVLIVIGMVISGLLSLGRITAKAAQLSLRSVRLPFLRMAFVGLLHTLAFCPASAGLYFGVLIPLAMNHASEILFSSIYGVGAGLPFVIIAFLSNAGLSFLSLKKGGLVDVWLPRIGGVLLIGLGIYFSLERILNIWA